MPSKICPANKSSLFAVTGSTELGGGADDHLPVGGPWGAYTFASAVRFGFDWTGVKRITSAILALRTTGQVHVGFSSAPDFYVARATADWTANGASSGSEGGSGWSTSPTVYPGPPSTSTGRVSKRAATTENTWVEVDIAAIVRAWAPATVEGGGNQPNYGILLSRVASGDVTEFYSRTSGSVPPKITLYYDTDTPPPAPTHTAPVAGAVVTTKRPTFTATCVDPDGDPLQGGDIAVYSGSTVVNSGAMSWGTSSLAYTPTVDLPSGALTWRCRAKANGVTGAWSTATAFTVDRAPTVTAFTAPPATVSANLRPPIAFTTQDLDGDALELYDLEVYADGGGGVPTGG